MSDRVPSDDRFRGSFFDPDPDITMPRKRYWVMMMVSTTFEAENAAEAEQMACDLLHPLVMDAKLGIHSVEKVIDVSEGRKASEIVDELGEQT